MNNTDLPIDVHALKQAFRYLEQYRGKLIVVKYGGNALGEDGDMKPFAENIAFLHKVGLQIIVVHGGGPQLKAELKRQNITSDFIDGERITPLPVLEIAEKVFSGQINKNLAAAISEAGVSALDYPGAMRHW